MASQTPMPNESYFLGGSSPASTAVIPCVESDLPRPCDYQELLERAHHLNRYSNFGELSDEFANGLLKAFGNPGEVCVTCNSATAGLSAALIASGVGSNVLIPAFTFPATYGAVRAAGLVPLIMDVDPTTWAIAPERLEAMIKSTGAKAVILVAPFGITTDFSSHVAVCRQHGVTVIIDCAAGLGVKRMTPCDDDDIFEVFSLHATMQARLFVASVNARGHHLNLRNPIFQKNADKATYRSPPLARSSHRAIRPSSPRDRRSTGR